MWATPSEIVSSANADSADQSDIIYLTANVQPSGGYN